jgi:hypothetical protein
VQLAPGDELVDVGGIAVVFLGLLLAPSAQEEPDTANDGCKANYAYDNACCNAGRVGLAVLLLLGCRCGRRRASLLCRL